MYRPPIGPVSAIERAIVCMRMPGLADLRQPISRGLLHTATSGAAPAFFKPRLFYARCARRLLRTSGNGPRKPEWRAALDFPVEALAREARSADLIVIGQTQRSRGRYRSLDAGSAILKVGRPTLVVPEDASFSLRAEHVVIGWKDTREARRAVRDALPFLQQATRVTIVETCGPGEEKTALERLDDLASYLSRHRIKGGAKVMLEQKGSGAQQLIRLANFSSPRARRAN